MRPSLLIVLLGLAACNTPCQRLCIQMADYAEECGITVSESTLQTCIDEQADGDQASCRQTGDADTLRREWDCADLAVFFE